MSGYRWWIALAALALAAFITLAPRPEATPAAPNLAAVPAFFNGWGADDYPIDPRLVAASKADAYLNRVYRRGEQEAGLYVGFYRSQRAGDSVHSPKNCLPGGGWQPLRSALATLPLADGRRPEVNLYLVENERHRLVVLYWYQSHGNLVASEYAAKLQVLHDALVLRRTDSALVRIAVPVTSSEEQATQAAIAFAAEIAPRLDEVIPR